MRVLVALWQVLKDRISTRFHYSLNERSNQDNEEAKVCQGFPGQKRLTVSVI